MKAKLFNLTLVFVLVLGLVYIPAAGAVGIQGDAGKPSASKVVFFAADGMRPDLMERYTDKGLMPTYAQLMAEGVRGDNGWCKL
jgi:predicted AlkP superfamily pyrophosphatase or phosphodiesterase